LLCLIACNEANTIQVRQIDVANNVSDIGKNTLRIVVDNTNPIFDLQPEYTQVATTSKLLTVITPLLVMPSLSDRPVSTKSNVGNNVSDIGKNTFRIVVDNTDPTFDLQPTEINADVNTPITTTAYDAQATNLNGGNAEW
jgi:hypothetical protein